MSEAHAIIDAGRLYREHAPFVARFLMRMGVLAQDLDDLLQEVFLVAHRRGGFQPGLASPSTWLAEIGLRVASQRRRTDRRRPESSDSPLASLPGGGRSPADVLQIAQSLERVQSALEALDLADRAVFVLFEIEGQDGAAIAAGLSIPIGTVHSRLHRARRAFERSYARIAARDERQERLIPEVKRA